MMSPNDYVGVAGSTDQIEFVAPLQLARDKEAIAQEVGKIERGRRRHLYPPVAGIRRTRHLAKQDTRVRHLILHGGRK